MADTRASDHLIEFAWIELTNLCNLKCSHCYSESSPFSSEKDILSKDDYCRVLEELAEIGCKQVQFIGGEPTLNNNLPLLIKHASRLGFEFIEVFSNLVTISETLWEIFETYDVALATSFYSFDREMHNGITKSNISYDKTLASIKRALAADLAIRVGFIEMEQNCGQFSRTKHFLEALGVKAIGHDRVRAIGRANEEQTCDMGELCGSCSGNILSIAPDGTVAPCNMSKAWAVGNFLDTPLQELAASDAIISTRARIKDAVGYNEMMQVEAVCDPKTCGPYSYCCPSTQQCLPCAPNGCNPCFPKG